MTAGLRTGIIGAGFMGTVHANAVRAAGGVVSRVAVARPDRAPEAAARLGALGWVASAEELIAADDVDIVHVCTPNVTHAGLAELALLARKPVVCEKPLATSVLDAERLADLAASSEAVAAVPFVYRYYPSVREAKARVEGGEAGDLWLLHGSYLQDWLANSDETNWRVDPRQGGGSRTFADIGVHWCDLMEFTTGHRITRLTALMSRAYDARSGHQGVSPVDTEDGAVVMFETDGGATGSVVASQVSPGRKNRLWFSFDGTDTSFVFDQEQPDTLWIGGRQENRVLLRGPETLSSPSAQKYSRLPAGHPQGYQDCFNAFISDVHAAILDANEWPEGLPSFDDGRRAAVITEAVIDSAKNQTWVEVPK